MNTPPIDEGTVIHEFLNDVLSRIDNGFGLIDGDVNRLFTSLTAISLILAGIYWAFGKDDAILSLTRRVLLIGFFSFLIKEWSLLTSVVQNSFIALGLKAGGTSFTLEDFLDPGAIAVKGWQTGQLLILAADQLTGDWRSTLENLTDIALLTVSAFVVIVAYFTLAAQVFIALVVFKLGALLTFVLIPFAVLTQTSFIAERPFGWLVGSGVRIMGLAFVVSVGFRLMNERLIVPKEVSEREAVALAYGAVLLLVLAWVVPTLARDVVSGGPTLALGDAVSVGVSSGAAGVAAGAVGLSAARHAAGGSMAALRGAGALGRSAKATPGFVKSSASSVKTQALRIGSKVSSLRGSSK